MDKQPLKPSFFTFRSFLWIIVFILSFCIALLIGYWLGFSQAEDELEYERAQSRNLAEQIRQIAEVDDSEMQNSKSKQVSDLIELKKELETFIAKERSSIPIKAQHEYSSVPPPAPKRAIISNNRNAKLVIIIDDVSYQHDLKAVQSTGLPLVLSFLPPNSRHPESAALAQQYKQAMVHLPLEAVNFKDEETYTLHVNDSVETIEKRIAHLKKLYPNIRYYNNHTGSKFTGDLAAMERLMSVLKQEGIIFVDSRTTGNTKVPEAAQKFDMRYISRDIFLDHYDGVGNIKKQIAEAVKIAQRHGSAIAIGHPRPDTIRALKESRAILNQVQLVSIEQI